MKLLSRPSARGLLHQFYCPGCKLLHVLEVGHYFDSHGLTSSGLIFWRPIGSPTCESIITKNMITFSENCAHELAGKTVELPDVPENCGG